MKIQQDATQAPKKKFITHSSLTATFLVQYLTNFDSNSPILTWISYKQVH